LSYTRTTFNLFRKTHYNNIINGNTCQQFFLTFFNF